MNHRLFLYLISIFLGTFTLNAQWISEKSSTSSNLKAISFTGESKGWIAGDKGIILQKSGNQWKSCQSPTKNNINDIFMLNDTEGWAVGDKGTILRYNGRSWENVESPVRSNLYSVSFNSSEEGISVGANGVILKYGNRQWKLFDRNIHGNLYVTSGRTETTWIAGGIECVNFPIMKIRNDLSGAIINSVKLPATITGLSMISDEEGWAVGSPGTILHFTGSEWKQESTDISHPSLKSVYFADHENGISVGFGGTVLIYSGGSWSKEESFIRSSLNKALIVGTTYYAIGDKGVIITKKMDDENLKFKTLGEYTDLTIFPNPSDGKINFTLPDGSDAAYLIATISDGDGKVVYQKKISGDGNSTFGVNGGNLSNGLYLLKVNSGARTYLGRFIVNH
jgi:photosystem II stability/assembly factor-like uncharacterized protein